MAFVRTYYGGSLWKFTRLPHIFYTTRGNKNRFTLGEYFDLLSRLCLLRISTLMHSACNTADIRRARNMPRRARFLRTGYSCQTRRLSLSCIISASSIFACATNTCALHTLTSILTCISFSSHKSLWAFTSAHLLTLRQIFHTDARYV